MGDFDRIEFEGKTIEDYLLDEDTKEIVNVMEDQQFYIKKKGRGKYMDKKDRDGAVSVTPQSEINALNLTNNLTIAKTRVNKVIMRLLAGQRLTSHAIVKYMGVRASDAATLLRLIWKSGLQPFCMREGDGSKGFFYSFKPAGLELKPKQAVEFFKTKGEERSTPKPEIEFNPLIDTVDPRLHQPEAPPPVVEQEHKVNINVNVTFSFKWGD